jgi:hypothetical protein
MAPSKTTVAIPTQTIHFLFDERVMLISVHANVEEDANRGSQ